MALTVAQTPVEHHLANVRGRDFVVADLHGCLELLWRLLRHVQFDPSRDRVWSVGDLTDRGPDSWGCLRLLKQPWFHAVLGNHDALLLNHLKNPVKIRHHDEGWLADLSPSRESRQALASVWIEALESLPAVQVVGAGTPGRFQVVHGELLNDGPPVSEVMIDTWDFVDRQRTLERATYGRSLLQTWREGKPVRRAHMPNLSPIYCGHTIVPRACWLARQVYLDMGAFLGMSPAGLTDEGENESTTPMMEPGLVLVQPNTPQAWLAPSLQHNSVIPLTIAELDAF
jgi:serine/threonine protein phosphatase 1